MRRVRLPNGKAVHSSALRTSLSSDRVVKSVFTAVKSRTFQSFAMAAKGSEIAQGPVGLKVFCIRTGDSKDCIVGSLDDAGSESFAGSFRHYRFPSQQSS